MSVYWIIILLVLIGLLIWINNSYVNVSDPQTGYYTIDPDPTSEELWKRNTMDISRLSQPLKTCKLFSGEKEYRLGDMILNVWRWKTGGEDYHLENFPDSIASEYMRKSQTQKNYDVLFQIVNRRSINAVIPENNTLVVHLRTGDVIEDSKHSVFEILTYYTYLNSQSWSQYTPPLKYFAQKIEEIDPFIQKVVLVTGSHKDIPTPKSCQYITAVQEFFKQQGFIVELRMGMSPDQDFIYMCNAKFFINSNGGYSQLIKTIVEMMGNQIV